MVETYTADELEKELLEKIEEADELPLDTVISLVWLYTKTKRQQKAFEWTRRMLSSTEDQDVQAECLLRLGQISEQMNDYESALSFYMQTVDLEPKGLSCRYLANNNLGYYLNLFGRYDEAEPYCKKAIDISPDRHNAYKNLGVSLEGQGQYGLAAEQYIKAAFRYPADRRALNHLEKLWGNHPEVTKELPDIEKKISECRELINRYSC